MDLLQKHLDDGYLMSTKHPTADLWIYNYTAKCQYERAWDDTTLACRGLILDAQGRAVARPFRKFFNLEEHPAEGIPNEPFEVFEKMDGSLGILYWLEEQPFIASRGSFTSEQAQRATEWLRSKYADLWPRLHPSRTYLFEIIYPQNRIVVDYGAVEGLFLLAVTDTETGRDLPLEDIGFPVVQRFDGTRDFAALKQRNLPNREGYVLKFQNGFRVKVKFEEYVRLHRLLTQCSNVSIWENLSIGAPLDELLERVPDEFYDWVRKTKEDLERQYAAIEAECRVAFRVLETRKETALYFQTQPHSRILFSMLDGKDYSASIWKLLRPVFSKPFRAET